MRRRLGRLAEVRPGEWPVLLQLALLALGTGLALRLMPLPRVTRLLAAGARTRALGWWPLGRARCRGDRLDRLADLAAAAVPGEGRCLARALLHVWLLAGRGRPVALVLGAERRGGRLRGHAWIETPGGPVGETPATVARFARVVRLEAR
jgi:hypothetical protein